MLSNYGRVFLKKNNQQLASYIPRSKIMEHLLQLHIEYLPEGVYLATSDDIQGLIAQGCTIAETLEIARDVLKKLIEAKVAPPELPPVCKSFDYP
jgi:predicted RNase H-like HicB family nuclease